MYGSCMPLIFVVVDTFPNVALEFSDVSKQACHEDGALIFGLGVSALV